MKCLVHAQIAEAACRVGWDAIAVKLYFLNIMMLIYSGDIIESELVLEFQLLYSAFKACFLAF